MFSQIVRRVEANISVWKARQSYIGSAAQRKMHSYVRDEAQFKKERNNIDIEAVRKISKGKFMIREFLFQQKVQKNYVAPLNCNLLPTGKWTRAETKMQNMVIKSNTVVQNEAILQDCQKIFTSVFNQYFTKIGKRGYKFILSQEIGKISNMSEQQFTDFVKIFGQDYKKIARAIKDQKKV